MPKESSAVIVNVPGLPAVTVEGKPATTNVFAAAGLTVIVALPVMVPLTVSVAVTDWLPALTRVTPLVNMCTPLSPATNV